MVRNDDYNQEKTSLTGSTVVSTCEQQYKRQRIPIAAVITLEHVNSKIDMT